MMFIFLKLNLFKSFLPAFKFNLPVSGHLHDDLLNAPAPAGKSHEWTPQRGPCHCDFFHTKDCHLDHMIVLKKRRCPRNFQHWTCVLQPTDCQLEQLLDSVVCFCFWIVCFLTAWTSIFFLTPQPPSSEQHFKMPKSLKLISEQCFGCAVQQMLSSCWKKAIFGNFQLFFGKVLLPASCYNCSSRASNLSNSVMTMRDWTFLLGLGLRAAGSAVFALNAAVQLTPPHIYLLTRRMLAAIQSLKVDLLPASRVRPCLLSHVRPCLP